MENPPIFPGKYYQQLNGGFSQPAMLVLPANDPLKYQRSQ